MTASFVLCDVFGERPFTGNQLAVFLDAERMTDEQMMALAREFGWSEVTFICGPPRDGRAPVRIWTVQGELPFAGHPTVGTAVVLCWAGLLRPGRLVLELGIGPVEVEVRLDEPNRGTATMTQRAPEFGATYDDRETLAAAVGLTPDDLVGGLPAQGVSTGLMHAMVPVRTRKTLSRARVDPAIFPSVLPALGARWLYLFTTDTESGAAARTRLVGPGMDDPATGSAAGPLGAYMVHYGLHAPGALWIEQGIDFGRLSRLDVEVPITDGEIGPVKVGGAVHVWGRGALLGD